MKINANIDPHTVKEAEDILLRLGIPLSLAFNLFLRQVILQRGLPFELSAPDKNKYIPVKRERLNDNK